MTTTHDTTSSHNATPHDPAWAHLPPPPAGRFDPPKAPNRTGAAVAGVLVALAVPPLLGLLALMAYSAMWTGGC